MQASPGTATQLELQPKFPVDGQLLKVLPRASASVRHPDLQEPTLYCDGNSYYLEMRVESNTEEEGEVAVTRRVPLDYLTDEEWQELKASYGQLDLSKISEQGLGAGLETISDRRIQRLFMALMTFLNPRHVAILLYLYREAASQGNVPIVSFRSNELLAALGYTKTKDGGYPSKVRSQLNRDLVALHRTELLFAQSMKKEDRVGAKVTVKSVLRIKDYEIDNVPRDFDLIKAADYTYELADVYTISLEFFEGPSRTGDYVLFTNDIDIRQRLGTTTKVDYRMKLLVYLASRMKWDSLKEGKFLCISKSCLFKNLDLLGSNLSRNNQILWRTVEDLRKEQFILEAQEIPGKKKALNIQFLVNPDKIRANQVANPGF
jgi:hypothetical protein